MTQPAVIVPLPGPVRLALLRCRVCGAAEPPVVIASDSADDGLLAYCSVACARSEGWPWLRSERHGRRGAHG